ncbi:MAG: AAA family ATPase, partial [Saprospiraceae bacterium]
MEDIEKYIFDPNNTEIFKGYKLLLKILKEDNYYIYISPSFILDFLKENLIEKNIIENIYSQPKEVLKKLSGSEIGIIYSKDYSVKELEEVIQQNLELLTDNSFSFLIKNNFIEVIEEKYKTVLLRKSSSIEFNLNPSYNSLPDYCLNSKEFNHISSYSSIKNVNEKNIIFFITEKDTNFLNSFSPLKSFLVFLPSGEVLKKIPDNLLAIRNNLKFVHLRNIEEYSIFFDFVKSVQKTQNRKKINIKTFVYPQKFELKNYFSIKNLSFSNIKTKREIYFLGENGDGKTLLMQAILLSLIGDLNIGLISDFLKSNNDNNLSLISTDEQGNFSGININSENKKVSYSRIYAYGVNRFQNDSDKKDKYGFLTLFSHNEYLENPVKWLQHLDYQEKSGNQPDIPLEKAKKLLNELLEENVEIEVSPNGVDFYERGTKLKFEQLSDGYKSVLVWMCDLLSRLAAKQREAEHISDFHGIVLVDEIGMFLHPKWQRTIVKKLRTTFPNIQFFFTTHSPIVLLGASE